MPRGLRSRVALGGPPALAALALQLANCGGLGASANHAGPGNDASVGGADGAASYGAASLCEGGVCPVATCLIDNPTTLTGKVFDPAGLNPLANVVVFVPSDPGSLPAIEQGSPSCLLPTLGSYVVATDTNASGAFTLTNVPTGSAVPLTVQIGKWRRTITLPVANPCAMNPVADGTLRLPRNRSEGDLPQIALLTGGADNLGCLLLGIGVDASEFGGPGSGASVDVYRGVGGASLADAAAGDCTGADCPLWNSPANLDAYDVVLLGCEGAANLQTKPPMAMQSMHDWLARGGKLFGVHEEDAWFSQGPADFQAAATWVDGSASGATGPFVINTTAFPAGQSFEEWANGNGAAAADAGLLLSPSDVATSVSAVGPTAAAWIFDESTAGTVDGSAFAGNVKALTVAIPSTTDGSVPENSCGRALLTDIHPGGMTPLSPVPSACLGGGLGAEEKALEYLFFGEFLTVETPTCACPPPPPPHSPQ